MQQGYIFALAFLALAVYNGLRAWWNLRGELLGFTKLANGWNQRVIIGLVCVLFGLLALGASAYMGLKTWHDEQQQAQVAPTIDDLSK
jgi:hypothetical protein